MYYAFDRLEGDVAVLQDDQKASHDVEIALLPAGAAPGDVFVLEDGAYRPAPDEAARRRERALALQKRLRERGQPGR